MLPPTITLNPIRHGGGGIRPPSSFFEVYEKVLEAETSKSVTFQEM